MSFVEMLTEQVLPNLLELIGALCGGLLAWCLVKAKSWITAKIGKSNYDRAIEVAKGIYVLLEDEVNEIKKTGAQKKAEMEAMLLKQFPSLTKTELDAINKTVWESFNQKYTQGTTYLIGEGIEVEDDLNE